MTAQQRSNDVVFKVLDMMPGPHGGWLLRLRLQEGDAPSLKELKGSRMRLEGSEGVQREVTVRNFPVMGGKPSDSRFARTGRVDVYADPTDDGEASPPVFIGTWTLSGAPA